MLQETGTGIERVASYPHIHTITKIPQKFSKAPTHLYLKGRIFYYRFRFPKKFCAYPTREIRISLHTAYHCEAALRASKVHGFVLEELEKCQMSKDAQDSINVKAIERIRKAAAQTVDEILNSGRKQPIEATDLRKRLNSWLQKKLDQERMEMEPFKSGIENPDGTINEDDWSESFSNQARRLGRDMATGDNFNQHLNEGVLELVGEGILKPSEISDDNVTGIIKAYLGMKATFFNILAARVKGDFIAEQPIYASGISEISSKNAPERKNPDLLLSELIEEYCKTKIDEGAWQIRCLSDQKNRVLSLLRILGDKQISDIDRQDIRSFRDKLKKLPPRWNQQLEKKKISVDKIILTNGSGKTLDIKTVNGMVEAVSSMFSWAIKERKLEYNPAAGLCLKDNTQDIEKKPPFTEEDLKNIFSPEDYKLENFKNPAYYWVPLIGLYTGMRLEEICQLHCADIYQEDELWIFDIRTESTDGLLDKNIKTVNAKRKIPIHSRLQELGLIQYRDALIKQNELRMFPLLNKTERTHRYGKQVGKQFSKLLKKKGISAGKSFHSLRHTFSQFFKVRNMHTDLFRQVFGHDIPNLAGKRYGDKFPVRQIYEELISKLNFNI